MGAIVETADAIQRAKRKGVKALLEHAGIDFPETLDHETSALVKEKMKENGLTLTQLKDKLDRYLLLKKDGKLKGIAVVDVQDIGDSIMVNGFMVIDEEKMSKLDEALKEALKNE